MVGPHWLAASPSVRGLSEPRCSSPQLMFCTRPPQRRAAGSKLLSYPHTVPSFRRALSTPMAADIAARNVCTAGMALTSGRWMRCGRRMRCSEGALSGSQSQASALWAVRLNPQASGRSGISGSPSSDRLPWSCLKCPIGSMLSRFSPQAAGVKRQSLAPCFASGCSSLWCSSHPLLMT